MLEIYYGTVKFFSVPRGFGFVRRTSDGEEFYIFIVPSWTGSPVNETLGLELSLNSTWADSKKK
jgi:hypothetical protein